MVAQATAGGTYRQNPSHSISQKSGPEVIGPDSKPGAPRGCTFSSRDRRHAPRFTEPLTRLSGPRCHGSDSIDQPHSAARHSRRGPLFSFVVWPAPPSTTECVERWNLAGNRAAHVAVAAAEFSRANVAGWTIKVGDYCSATFFTRPGSQWVNYVLWIDAPEPRVAFGRDIGGLRYGR